MPLAAGTGVPPAPKRPLPQPYGQNAPVLPNLPNLPVPAGPCLSLAIFFLHHPPTVTSCIGPGAYTGQASVQESRPPEQASNDSLLTTLAVRVSYLSGNGRPCYRSASI